MISPPSGGARYIRSLDGMRGVAVSMVLLYHGTFGHFRGGFLGVDVFFVLSGFLITRLLAVELETTGRVDWAGFYVRRAGRLLPALFVLLLGSALLWPYLGAEQPLRSMLPPIVFYYANWTTAYSGWLGPLAHVWSLSVEEQFYLVWPVCFVLLSRRRLSVPVVVAAIGVSAAGRALLHAQGSPLGSYVSTLSRADELLVGALAACLPGVAPERALRYSALGTLALLPIAIVAIDYHDAWLYAGGFTVIALVVAGVILHLAGTSTSVMKRMLESGPLVGAGRISYGLYLFHLPVFKLLEPLGRPHSIVARVMVLVLQCVVTYAVAWLSYRLVEAPVLQRARSLHARVAARRTQHFQPVVLP